MRHFLIILSVFFYSTIFSNITVYFSYNTFNTSNSKPFLETYLTISANSVKFSPVSGGYQANVNVSWNIFKGKDLIKSSNYNVMSPVVLDTLNLPSFIDSQRFQLDNGQYILELVVMDNTNPEKKSTHSEKITISYKRDKKASTSDLQALESYSKSLSQSVLTKSGYDMVPYSINYYPKTQNSLKFYIETYNLDTVLGSNTKFVYAYYVENNENFYKIAGFSGFQRQNAGRVNPLLAQFDITQLPTGNYNLVILVKDSANVLLTEKKWFFQRQSNAKPIQNEDVTVKTVEEFFNLVQSTDSLKEFIECLWPISFTTERERQQVQLTREETSLMRSYMVEFWKTEAGDSLDPLKAWLTYYKQVQEANALLKCGKQKGYYTDRGRVYLQYGKPSQRGQYGNEPGVYPYEVWQYYRIYDRATKRFFSNKRFVFANFSIGDECYKLIHSEVRGEVYDERWKYRLVNRTQHGNMDETSPNKTYGSNIEENFNNPR